MDKGIKETIEHFKSLKQTYQDSVTELEKKESRDVYDSYLLCYNRYFLSITTEIIDGFSETPTEEECHEALDSMDKVISSFDKDTIWEIFKVAYMEGFKNSLARRKQRLEKTINKKKEK